jgi:hypothetical protein
MAKVRKSIPENQDFLAILSKNELKRAENGPKSCDSGPFLYKSVCILFHSFEVLTRLCINADHLSFIYK